MRLVPLALLLATVAACSSPAPVAVPPTPVPSTSAAPTPDSSPSAATVPETLKFTASTVDGKTFDAATLAGKPAVFWFWASWCPKCRGDAAEVRDLQAQQAGKVAIVGVAGLRSGNGMKGFVSDYKLTGFPQLADDAGTVWKKFNVPSQHYYVILDSSGAVVHRGPLTVAQLRDKVSGLK